MDTNVLVSGLLSPHGPPGRIVDLLVVGRIRAIFDDRFVAKYRNVLLRPKFGLKATDVEVLMDVIESDGEPVAAEPLVEGALPDPDDMPFLEVAVSAAADALVTGNTRHFRESARPYGLRVVSPSELMAGWGREEAQ